MANKLTTMGYFVKRLRDNGYVVDRLYGNYAFSDPRTWTVVIDPGQASIFCTCYHNGYDKDDNSVSNYFEIYDGGQFIPGRYKIETNSIEQFISYLVKFGINNKIKGYPQTRNERDEREEKETQNASELN